MPRFELIEAKPWHCGAMVRLLRREHQQAVAMIGLRSHSVLRSTFDDSVWRKAWTIDGKLAAIGGVTGPALSSYGLVWLAFSRAATKYPLAITKMVRSQLDEIMRTKRLLITSVLEGDEASARFAIFMGFVPAAGGDSMEPASSRFGRIEVSRKLKEMDNARVPFGTGYVNVMSYRQIEAT